MINEIGIKLNNNIILKERTSKFKKLLKTGYNYIEYQAPVFDINTFSKLIEVSENNLKPHSTFLSLSKLNGISKTTSIRLREEIIRTKSKYLGEHVGSINESGVFPTSFYLYPPSLDKNTISYIKTNSNLLYKIIRIPIALENPMFYAYRDDDKMDFLSFMKALDVSLPVHVGWLIDISHLIASCANLNCDLTTAIEFFLKTKRKIYEIHLSSLSTSTSGIVDDNHNISHKDDYFQFNLKIAKLLMRPHTNLTIETKELKLKELIKIYNMAASSKTESLNNLLDSAVIKKLIKSKNQRTNYIKKYELTGRRKIVSKSISDFVSSKIDNDKLFTFFKFNNYEEMSKRYIKFSIDPYLIPKIDYTHTPLALIYFFSENLRKKTFTNRLTLKKTFDFFEGLASDYAVILSLNINSKVKINFNFFLGNVLQNSFVVTAKKTNVKVTKYKFSSKFHSSYDIYI